MDQHLGPNALEDEPHHQELLRKCAEELAAREGLPMRLAPAPQAVTQRLLSSRDDLRVQGARRRPASLASSRGTLSPGTNCRHRLS
jgi:hypothetical protein